MSKLRRDVRVPKPGDDESLFRFFIKAFGSFGCFVFIVWAVSAIASLALVGAIIYFLIKAAGAL